MGEPTPAPPATLVKWLGGRVYQVHDLRELPGPLAFTVTDEDMSVQIRVRKGTATEAEIAALIT